MMELRPYQAAAKAAAYNHLDAHSDNPLVVIPTGGGTTPVIASICQDAAAKQGERVLILAPSDWCGLFVARKLKALCPQLPDGIFLWERRRITRTSRVIVGSIGSVGTLANKLGAFDVVLLAKAHLIRPGDDQAYQQFLAAARAENPNLRIVGFAAMPYRIKKGGAVCTAQPICSAGYLNYVCYEIGIRDLIAAGFLTPVVTKVAVHRFETELLPLFGGDFYGGGAEELIGQPAVVDATCAEIVANTRDRRSVLVFPAPGFHGINVVHKLRKHHQVQAGLLSHSISTDEHADLAAQYRDGKLQYLVVNDLLTTSFDAPHVDCVVLLRPTISRGYYSYMVGRGLRLHAGKKDCLVLDFVGNALRHGPIDQFMAGVPARSGAKACADCRSVFAIDGGSCPDCGGELLPPKYKRLVVSASEFGLPANAISTEFAVSQVRYDVHTKQNARPGAPKSMRVDYQDRYGQRQSEFICFGHTGYARQKAVKWWRRRSREAVPSTAERAVAIASNGGVAHTARITVAKVADEKFGRIIGYELVVPWG